jgi:hypothetical protein
MNGDGARIRAFRADPVFVALVRESRRRQGLPPKIDDPDQLDVAIAVMSAAVAGRKRGRKR